LDLWRWFVYRFLLWGEAVFAALRLREYGQKSEEKLGKTLGTVTFG
jgi:hypothetical protein